MKDYFGVDRSPTKEEKLRMEYPELLDNFLTWQESILTLKEIKSEFKEFSFVDKIFRREKYLDYIDRTIEQEQIIDELESEYEFLKKLVWEY